MAQRIEDVLDGCLKRLLEGEGIEDCLRTYPEYASELEPLLKTSAALMRSSFAIQPAPEFKARVRSQLQGMLYARKEVRGRSGASMGHRRWVLAVTSVLLIFIVGLGTVAASDRALPDETLYPVKLATEDARMLLALSDMNKARLHIQFAERRAAEMSEMARQGKSDKALVLARMIETHVDRLDKILEAEETQQAGGKEAGALTPADGTREQLTLSGAGDENIVAKLNKSRAANLDTLEADSDKAPKELRDSLKQAIKKITEDYDMTISIIESGSGS